MSYALQKFKRRIVGVLIDASGLEHWSNAIYDGTEKPAGDLRVKSWEKAWYDASGTVNAGKQTWLAFD